MIPYFLYITCFIGIISVACIYTSHSEAINKVYTNSAASNQMTITKESNLSEDTTNNFNEVLLLEAKIKEQKAINNIKWTGLITSLINLFITIVIFFLYNFSSIQFQFVQQYENIDLIIKNLPFDFYLGIDGTSIYFIMLTGIILPISILSNWKSVNENMKSYIIIMLLLEILLITVFLVLDTLSFYIFFESILPPLFLLVGFFGSSNKVKASYYLFLYTLLGSLFMLLSILTTISIMGVSDYSALFKNYFEYSTQIFIFIGIFIAFAVKTPTIFLNTWLLKAHVESPLGGSIILAAIVLKLSLYGIMRLILPILPKSTFTFTTVVYSIAVITILYASISTLRTVDIKELIAYSSVSHAAVYILGVFSNTIIGIEGAIVLGLAHGFVSSGLFICVGGVLYDRSSTRMITFYRGMTQVMPLFSILFFILCLGNSGTPLTLNFVGEFMCLFGSFEQLPIMGAIACSSIVFSAAYTIYMYNRIAFGGYYSKFFMHNITDVNKREFYMLCILVIFAVVLGIYVSPILDGLHFNISDLIYHSFNIPSFDLSLYSLAGFSFFCYTKRPSNGYFVNEEIIKHVCFSTTTILLASNNSNNNNDDSDTDMEGTDSSYSDNESYESYDSDGNPKNNTVEDYINAAVDKIHIRDSDHQLDARYIRRDNPRFQEYHDRTNESLDLAERNIEKMKQLDPNDPSSLDEARRLNREIEVSHIECQAIQEEIKGELRPVDSAAYEISDNEDNNVNLSDNSQGNNSSSNDSMSGISDSDGESMEISDNDNEDNSNNNSGFGGLGSSSGPSIGANSNNNSGENNNSSQQNSLPNFLPGVYDEENKSTIDWIIDHEDNSFIDFNDFSD